MLGDASWRVVRNYPTLKPKRLEAKPAEKIINVTTKLKPERDVMSTETCGI